MSESQFEASNDVAADYKRQVITQRRRVSEENGILRNIYKRAKADGLNLKALKASCDAAKLDPTEVVRDLRDTVHYISLSTPIESSGLFDGWSVRMSPETREQEAVFGAEDAGYRAGRAGTAQGDCPFASGTTQAGAWVKQWKLGAASRAKELGPAAKQVVAERARPKRKAGNGEVIALPAPPKRARKMGPRRRGPTRAPDGEMVY
jgi:ribosome modulation factor/uncharacterized protein (UPF0335 family)